MANPISSGTEFIVLCGQIVGSDKFETIYGFDGQRFSDRKAAIKHGFSIRGSDDFNIGVLASGKLISFDWMEKVVESDSASMTQIANQIGL